MNFIRNFVKNCSIIMAVIAVPYLLIMYVLMYQPDKFISFFEAVNLIVLGRGESEWLVFNAFMLIKYAVILLCALRWKQVSAVLAKISGRPESAGNIYKTWPTVLLVVVVIEMIGVLL